MEKEIRRPETDESFPYNNYIRKVPGHDFMKVLRSNFQESLQLFQSLSSSRWQHRYAPDKWSVKEVVLHLIDTERIFAYRALRMARHDKTPLAGFEQDDYVPFLDIERRTPSSIIEEYEDTRRATLSLFKNFTPEMLLQSGMAAGYHMSPHMIGFIIAGHELHHLDILKNRYL